MSGTRRRVRPAKAALLGFLGTMTAAAGVRAQDTACVLDECVGIKHQEPPSAAPAAGGPTAADAPAPTGTPALRPRASAAPGNFDFYVLALSWSPGFCATGGAGKARNQCAAGSNLGFVVHGLWPQYTHGFPSDCGPAGRVPSRQALDTVRGVYPDEGLARYEWGKHGTCVGKSPTDYFADVRRARDAVAIPSAFQVPREDQTWVPIDISRAFVAANSGLRADAMAVTCRQETLEEVRICLAKDLRAFVTCPEVSRASCRIRQVTVPAKKWPPRPVATLRAQWR